MPEHDHQEVTEHIMQQHMKKVQNIYGNVSVKPIKVYRGISIRMSG